MDLLKRNVSAPLLFLIDKFGIETVEMYLGYSNLSCATNYHQETIKTKNKTNFNSAILQKSCYDNLNKYFTEYLSVRRTQMKYIKTTSIRKMKMSSQLMKYCYTLFIVISSNYKTS